jgi:16S rRNA (cytosine967-C5)-methyltransferase
MKPAARIQATIDLLDAAAADPRPADAVASAYFRSRRFIGSKDRADIAGRFYAVLRHHARLGWWLDQARVADTPRARVIAELMLVGAVGRDELAALFDGDRYAPAPLNGDESRLADLAAGRSLDDPAMPDGVRHELPDWAVEPMKRSFSNRLDVEADALLEEAPLDLRVNEIKAVRDEVVSALESAGMTAEATALSPIGIRIAGRPNLAGTSLFKSGAVEVQDEGSQLVALLADARPGMQVADFCAGAGGKALAMAARMGGKGRVLACDVSEGRLARAKERMRRAGIDNIEPRRMATERDKWVKRSKGKFDRVLVDAPCSGTGAWRRNPDARWRAVDLDELTDLQSRILDSAARLVKPGGRLVYATCSLLMEENEDRVDGFLAQHPDFEILPVPALWTEAVGTGSPCPASGPYLRLSPAANGTDGFFVAVLARRVEGAGTPTGGKAEAA